MKYIFQSTYHKAETFILLYPDILFRLQNCTGLGTTTTILIVLNVKKIKNDQLTVAIKKEIVY